MVLNRLKRQTFRESVRASKVALEKDIPYFYPSYLKSKTGDNLKWKQKIWIWIFPVLSSKIVKRGGFHKVHDNQFDISVSRPFKNDISCSFIFLCPFLLYYALLFSFSATRIDWFAFYAKLKPHHRAIYFQNLNIDGTGFKGS